MTRLIDLDDDRHYYTGNMGDYENWNIDPEVPTVDAEPVIRCKDCAKCGTDDCAMRFEADDKFYQWNRADDYCSWAERKEE